MTHGEKMFVAKAVTNKIGATRAHNLLSSMKGGYEYVHGTTDDFKNHQRDVNVFIGESDAQIFINKMENRKMYVPNFTFQYKVENNELVAMFWADEVAKNQSTLAFCFRNFSSMIKSSLKATTATSSSSRNGY
ncbi:hypothetical protein Tco_0970075 [Tanacetum coccineum]